MNAVAVAVSPPPYLSTREVQRFTRELSEILRARLPKRSRVSVAAEHGKPVKVAVELLGLARFTFGSDSRRMLAATVEAYRPRGLAVSLEFLGGRSYNLPADRADLWGAL